MRISDWSSDVCSSDLGGVEHRRLQPQGDGDGQAQRPDGAVPFPVAGPESPQQAIAAEPPVDQDDRQQTQEQEGRSEEHTSELQSLMRISYAVFCLKKKSPSP